MKKTPEKVVFYYQDQCWTFKQVELYSNAVANAFIAQGFKPGDEVALFLDSKPEYIGLWLGLAKAGVIAALVNTNQRGQTLVHSITSIDCKALIFGVEYKEIVSEIVPLVEEKINIKYYCLDASYNSPQFSSPIVQQKTCINSHKSVSSNGKIVNGKNGSVNGISKSNNGYTCVEAHGPATYSSFPTEFFLLHKLLEKSSTDSSSITHRAKFTDRLFYIYTSGTTGLPKAAIIKHCRYIWIGSALRNLSGIRYGNTIYTCIPLYHLSGGVLGTNQCLIWGDAMVIRNRFSASSFWSDCIKYNCNMAQYIGEICRYLMAQPESPNDKAHKVHTVFGNGLRPQIWSQFVERFNIKYVAEFYGSTEGNANIINNTNKPGACGFISQILPKVYPVSLIRVDENTFEPIRDPVTGLCYRAGPGESGEFIGKIITNDASRAFDGYIDPEATKKKVIRDVYVKGDAAFRSGDILYMDDYGYVYFKDRTGDTFRWKGENVSTMEVEAVVSSILKLRDCIVYGVDVPGCEGKAGMVTILDPKKSIQLDYLLSQMKKRLPSYSIPIFVRIVDEIESTGTYKLPKNRLQREAYSLSVISSDPIYYLDTKKGVYERMDSTVHDAIVSGQIRF